MTIKAFKHLPDETEGYSDKLQVSRAQCETVVLPGVGGYQKLKNKQAVYKDFLHSTKL